uniref:Uncharacterized protein n=1 Tax=Hemiselmis tepida TaxID=464990 RepID=A0A7S0VRF8_9CRYP|mmetsp:Transcript_2248/g.5697  ORF Transcript_2248/g.5697 Transcript_2248/m.5697 type:complete len:271 (+) Transcript_2248:150-962(+)
MAERGSRPPPTGVLLLRLATLWILLGCCSGGAPSRNLLHEGRGVNMCSKNEDRPRIRNDCKSDPACVHESQCGCIPKGCTCGDEKCIYTHEEGKNYDSDAVDLDGGSSKTKSKRAHTHIIGDKQAFKIKHTHRGGKVHEHEGGGRKHHHTDDGEVVYDDEDGEEFGHHHHHKKDGKAKSRKAEQRSGEKKTLTEGKASGTSVLSKVPKWAWIGVGAVTAVCICGSVAVRGWCRMRGKSMLSKDMFNDSKEMQAFDWDSKVAAAGWASDDL